MSKTLGIFKGTYRILQIYLLAIIGIELVSVLVNLIIASTGVSGNTEVSPGNLITLFLVVMPIVIPLLTFKKLLVLGASRQDFYIGTMFTYLFWAVVFTLFNLIWLWIEHNLLDTYRSYLNILEIFHWDQQGVLGIILYQLGAYLLIISFLHLLSSCYWSRWGLALYVVVAAAISITMSIAPLRSAVVDGLSVLLFNPNLLVGFPLTVAAALLLFACGWWFTKRRQLAKV